MEYQALFNQMSKSMGIADEQAYLLSENFTKLGLDISSLYNISETDAMQKLRAGLAGLPQTGPSAGRSPGGAAGQAAGD